MDRTSISRRRLITGLALAAGLTIGGYGPLGLSTASAALPVDDDGPQPPPDTEAAGILASLVLGSFTATPAQVRPFRSTTLAWSVRRSGKSVGVAGIQFLVAGASVAASGQKVVTPVLNAQAYQLIARFDGASRILGTRIVTVDTSGALQLPVRPAQLQKLVTASLASLPPDVAERLKNPSVLVTIDTAGVHVRVTSEVEVDNFANPTVTIDLTVGIGAINGFITTRLLASNVKVAFPWWVHLVPPIVSEFIQNSIVKRITNEIQSALPALVSRAAAEANAMVMLPPEYGIWSVTPSSQLLTVTISQR